MSDQIRLGLSALLQDDDWIRLGGAARSAISHGLVVNQPQRVVFDAAVQALLAAQGWMQSTGARQGLPPGRRAAAAAARFLLRHRILAEGGETRLRDYLHQLLSREEREALFPGRSWNDGLDPHQQVASRQWLEGVLAVDAATRWRALLTQDLPGAAPTDAAVVQVVLDLVMRQREPWSWPALRAALRVARIDATAAIAALVRLIACGLVFIDLDADDLLPRLGLWPAVAAWRHRPAPAPVVPVAGVEVWQRAWLAEDLLILLSAAAGRPLEVRKSDRHLATRQLPELIARFASFSIPGETTEQAGAARLEAARQKAEELQWLCGNQGGPTRRVPSADGRRMMGEGVPGVVKVLAGRARAQLDRHQHGWESQYRMLALAGVYYSGGHVDIAPALGAALEVLAQHGEPVRFAAWREQVAVHNPFLARSTGYRAVVPPERAEATWHRLLGNVVFQVLLPIGGAAVAWHDGQRLVRLTAIGRWCLGLVTEWHCDLPEERSDILIKPDYEVVFLTPAPVLEARLSVFATRLGSGVGALFRLDRSSIQQAAAAGRTAEELLTLLRTSSRQPIPANVEREVNGWFAAIRRIRPRSLRIIDCGDEATLRAVLAVARDRVAVVPSTLVQVVDPAEEAALLRKLADKGIFVEERS